MKKTIISLSVFVILTILYSFANANVETYSLTIEVKDLRNSKGVVQIALYNQEKTIPDEAYKKYYKMVTTHITNGSATFTFLDIPSGKYAVNILHDENKNGKIDKGFILPLEGIGFSNYQTIGFSNRPSFSKASFDLKENQTMNIKVIYM